MSWASVALTRVSAVERVAAGRLEDAHHDRGRAVLPAAQIRHPGAEIDPRDVAHAHERAVGIGAHDDAAELLGAGQAALGLDVELKLLIGQRRLRADAPDRGLDILAPHCVGDIARRQTEAVIRSVFSHSFML